MNNHLFKRNLDEEWKGLHETIGRNYNRWREVTTCYSGHGPELIEQDIENNALLQALPRLLPLAKELQSDESLHCLMPWQHHGVLTLFLMDWERQAAHALVTILPTGEDGYKIYPHDENLPYSVRPLRQVESVPLGKIRSLIHAEWQARTTP